MFACCPIVSLVHGAAIAEGAALLVDHVIPAIGYRQWVLSFEGRWPCCVRPSPWRKPLEADKCRQSVDVVE